MIDKEKLRKEFIEIVAPTVYEYAANKPLESPDEWIQEYLGIAPEKRKDRVYQDRFAAAIDSIVADLTRYVEEEFEEKP